jgi:membrane protein DedA with SNARE-associated domain
VFWNALGGVAWATSVGLLAYFLGPTAERTFKVTGLAGAGVAALLVVGALMWRHLRSRKRVLADD